MATTPSSTEMSATLKAYEDKINAQIMDAKAKLDQFQAKAREQGSQAQNKAIEQLKTTRQNLEQKVHDLKTTHEANLERAKGDISAEVAKLHTSIDKATAEFNASMKK